MTGPEHYKAAEELLQRDRQVPMDGVTYVVPGPSELDLAEAQVHATLALVAAMAQLDAYEGPAGGSSTGRSAAEARAWESAFTQGESDG